MILEDQNLLTVMIPIDFDTSTKFGSLLSSQSFQFHVTCICFTYLLINKYRERAYIFKVHEHDLLKGIDKGLTNMIDEIFNNYLVKGSFPCLHDICFCMSSLFVNEYVCSNRASVSIVQVYSSSKPYLRCN